MLPAFKAIALAILLFLTPAEAFHPRSFTSETHKPVDRILIEKGKRSLSLRNGPQIVKSYKVALGAEPVGAKDRQGDHKTLRKFIPSMKKNQ